MKKVKFAFISAIIALFSIGLVTGQQTEKRVALVIGNGAYSQLPRLANPANDAGDLALKLISQKS